MDDTTILGSALGQLGQTIKKAGQQIVKLPEEMSKDVGGQIGGAAKPAASAEGSGPLRQSSSEASEPKQKQWQSDEERINFLKNLYGSSDMSKDGVLDSNKNANPNPPTNGKLSEFQEQIKEKSPEEQKKLIELRNQLHRDFYYDPTFNPQKKQEEQRPAEKVENEKKQEMQALQQEDAKKPPPLAVVREQNKAEMFRGAAG